MNKKLIIVIIAALSLFAVIAAVTQESDIYLPADQLSKEKPDFVKPLRWFRSNQGGMAVEEEPSGAAALRNEYALSAGFTQKSELPQNLVSFYDDEFFIEVRALYENGAQIRSQWLFREANGNTRVNAVTLESSASGNGEKRRSGFIEIFDKDSYLTTEYDFFDNGDDTKTDYQYKDNMLIGAVVSVMEEGRYVKSYGDTFRYNRSSFLRAIERVFYKDSSVSGELLIISFPRNVADALRPWNLTGENLNEYPGFFGEVYVEQNNNIVYTIDERGRVLTQTLYDEDGSIIWVIQNTWQNDRIVSTVKTEGGTQLLAEYEYNSDGERILERNYKNGTLERLVRTDGKTDIEELYLNGLLVLRAVWEDGRKISEERTGGR